MDKAQEMESALRAIIARISGEYDQGDLMRVGPLGTAAYDIKRIAEKALGII